MENEGLASRIIIYRSTTKFPLKITTIGPQISKMVKWDLNPKMATKPSQCS